MSGKKKEKSVVPSLYNSAGCPFLCQTMIMTSLPVFFLRKTQPQNVDAAEEVNEKDISLTILQTSPSLKLRSPGLLHSE
jgi:hypothetical protein